VNHRQLPGDTPITPHFCASLGHFIDSPPTVTAHTRYLGPNVQRSAPYSYTCQQRAGIVLDHTHFTFKNILVQRKPAPLLAFSHTSRNFRATL
jgi:hypothetical protein